MVESMPVRTSGLVMSMVEDGVDGWFIETRSGVSGREQAIAN
jgi:hypothetical protein